MLDTLHTDAPLTWTAELVEERLVEAFEILRAIGGRPGPKSYGSNWPAIVREIEDWRGDDEPTRCRPDKEAIGRMEEALQWPSRYLGADPKMADALNVWAFCKAMRMSLDKFMRARADRVTALARRAQAEHDAKRAEEIRKASAAVNAWAAERIIEARGDPDRIARIRVNAELRKERAVKAIKIKLVDPAAIMPDKAISATDLGRHRYPASGLVAHGLNRDRVPVPPEAAERLRADAQVAL